LILVDTSVWIALLNGNLGKQVSHDQLLGFVTCGPVVQEVLQGLRDDHRNGELRKSLFALPRLSDPLSLGVFLEAADIYRDGRAKGYTIRSSVDCLIAAIAIQNDVPVWHRDRDFTAIARFTRLRALERPGPGRI
jgi:predicted nucleic acid-binding protein